CWPDPSRGRAGARRARNLDQAQSRRPEIVSEVTRRHHEPTSPEPKPPMTDRSDELNAPSPWERHITLADGRRIFMRPTRREDEDLVRAYLAHVTPADLRPRFFGPVKEFGHAFITRLIDLDPARAIAFIALDEASGEMMGGTRLHTAEDGQSAEYAISLRSDLKGHGLGWQLMQLIIDYARVKGLRRIVGQVLAENHVM